MLKVETSGMENATRSVMVGYLPTVSKSPVSNPCTDRFTVLITRWLATLLDDPID